jgi:hypothetical protein
MKEIIVAAKKWALEEIDKYNGPPSLINFYTSLEKGQELAEKLNANKEIVEIGCILMDVKLAEAKSQGKIKEHIKLSADATEKFLEKFELDDKTKEKIVSCVNEHHGRDKFTCIESEICANADCYRFILPKNVFRLISEKDIESEEAIKLAKMKLEEKHNVLSLDICKKELEEYYQCFKKLFDGVK